jgi:hypothetical protein
MTYVCGAMRGDIDLCPGLFFFYLLYVYHFIYVVYLSAFYIFICALTYITANSRGIKRILFACLIILSGLVLAYYNFHRGIETIVYDKNSKLGVNLMRFNCRILSPRNSDNCLTQKINQKEEVEFKERKDLTAIICNDIEKPPSRVTKDSCYQYIFLIQDIDWITNRVLECKEISDECKRNFCFTETLSDLKKYYKEDILKKDGEYICKKVTTKEITDCIPNSAFVGRYQDYCYSIVKGTEK